MEHASDRIRKATGDLATAQEHRPVVEWQMLAKQAGLQEFEQAHFTCENSHGWSRIDRIYTDLHKADLMISMSYCSLLEHPRNLSDHAPIAFGLRNMKKSPKRYLPTWTATHVNYE